MNSVSMNTKKLQSNYLLLFQFQLYECDAWFFSLLFIRLKNPRIISESSKYLCVENAMRSYAHHVLPYYIALFIVMKSNSINTCQRYGIFELNTQFTIKFSLSFIRTFVLILSHFRYLVRSYERDIILCKRS